MTGKVIVYFVKPTYFISRSAFYILCFSVASISFFLQIFTFFYYTIQPTFLQKLKLKKENNKTLRWTDSVAILFHFSTALRSYESLQRGSGGRFCPRVCYWPRFWAHRSRRTAEMCRVKFLLFLLLVSKLRVEKGGWCLSVNRYDLSLCWQRIKVSRRDGITICLSSF